MKPFSLFTNEEIRTPIYHGGRNPTLAHEVTNETEIESLNLNWTEKQLPQKLRTKHVHGLHPYLGKYIPQLVEIFVRKFFQRGQTIIDPFVGSGTTLVQSNELGINSIGYDISSFNVLLCRVKIASYDIDLLSKEARDVLRLTERILSLHSQQLSFFEEEVLQNIDITGIDEYLTEWYAPQALRELLTYRNIINSENYRYKDVMRIILTRAARSARLTTHFDLDFPKFPQKDSYWCYKHARVCAPTRDAAKFLRRYTKDTIQRIKTFTQLRTAANVEVIHGDSRQIESQYADGIITSPPYVGLIDYHEQHAYAYHLLNLNDNRHREIGSTELGSGKAARAQYQEDIANTLKNTTRNLPRGAPIVIVAGDRHDLYPQIAIMSGLEQEAIIQRHVNRRTGRRSNEFFESIFVWRKP